MQHCLTFIQSHSHRNCLLQYRLFLLAAPLQQSDPKDNTALQLDLRTVVFFFFCACVFCHSGFYSGGAVPTLPSTWLIYFLLQLVTFCGMTFNDSHRGLCCAFAGGDATSYAGVCCVAAQIMKKKPQNIMLA